MVYLTVVFTQEYVDLRVHHELLVSRQRELEALKKGFESIPIQKHLRLFSAYELMGLLQVSS